MTEDDKNFIAGWTRSTRVVYELIRKYGKATMGPIFNEEDGYCRAKSWNKGHVLPSFLVGYDAARDAGFGR